MAKVELSSTAHGTRGKLSYVYWTKLASKSRKGRYFLFFFLQSIPIYNSCALAVSSGTRTRLIATKTPKSYRDESSRRARVVCREQLCYIPLKAKKRVKSIHSSLDRDRAS
jgi:hypothetical protein